MNYSLDMTTKMNPKMKAFCPGPDYIETMIN